MRQLFLTQSALGPQQSDVASNDLASGAWAIPFHPTKTRKCRVYDYSVYAAKRKLQMRTEGPMANKIWGAIGLVVLTGVGLYHAEHGRLPFTPPACRDAARFELQHASANLDEIMKRLKSGPSERDLLTIGLGGFQAAMMLGLEATARIDIQAVRADLVGVEGPQQACRTEADVIIRYATQNKQNTFSTTIRSGLVFVPSDGGGVRIIESQTLGAILTTIAADAMGR